MKIFMKCFDTSKIIPINDIQPQNGMMGLILNVSNSSLEEARNHNKGSQNYPISEKKAVKRYYPYNMHFAFCVPSRSMI